MSIPLSPSVSGSPPHPAAAAQQIGPGHQVPQLTPCLRGEPSPWSRNPPAFPSRWSFIQVLALYAQEHFLPLAKAVAVPVAFKGAGTSHPRWFFPALNQQQANAVLGTCPVGTFLVRKVQIRLTFCDKLCQAVTCFAMM